MLARPASPEILYRDERLAVLSKPSGVSLLADRSGADCLWDQLPRLLDAKPYLVHRLDKGTSGVLLVALDADTQRQLTRAFQQRLVGKYYLAWVSGSIAGEVTQIIDLPLRKGRKSRYRIAGRRDAIRRSSTGWHLLAPEAEGFASLTRIRVLRRRSGRTLLLAAPLTGRTHQLRVHLAWIGHPILGDYLYGPPGERRSPEPDEARQLRLQLHCHRLVVPGWGSFVARRREGWLRG